MVGTCVYDGDCGVCTSLAAWVARRSDCGLRPSGSVDLAAIGSTPEEAAATLLWISDRGRVTARGAAAVSEVLLTCGRGWPLLGRLLRLPGVRSLAEVGYRFVARHRHRLPGASTACRIDRRPG